MRNFKGWGKIALLLSIGCLWRQGIINVDWNKGFLYMSNLNLSILISNSGHRPAELRGIK